MTYIKVAINTHLINVSILTALKYLSQIRMTRWKLNNTVQKGDVNGKSFEFRSLV